jgi:hypothetical protein
LLNAAHPIPALSSKRTVQKGIFKMAISPETKQTFNLRSEVEYDVPSLVIPILDKNDEPVPGYSNTSLIFTLFTLLVLTVGGYFAYQSGWTTTATPTSTNQDATPVTPPVAQNAVPNAPVVPITPLAPAIKTP